MRYSQQCSRRRNVWKDTSPGKRKAPRRQAWCFRSLQSLFPHGSPIIGLYVLFLYPRPARILGYRGPREAMNSNVVSADVDREPEENCIHMAFVGKRDLGPLFNHPSQSFKARSRDGCLFPENLKSRWQQSPVAALTRIWREAFLCPHFNMNGLRPRSDSGPILYRISIETASYDHGRILFVIQHSSTRGFWDAGNA